MSKTIELSEHDMEYFTAVEAERDGEVVIVSKYEQEPWRILSP